MNHHTNGGLFRWGAGAGGSSTLGANPNDLIVLVGGKRVNVVPTSSDGGLFSFRVPTMDVQFPFQTSNGQVLSQRDAFFIPQTTTTTIEQWTVAIQQPEHPCSAPRYQVLERRAGHHHATIQPFGHANLHTTLQQQQNDGSLSVIRNGLSDSVGAAAPFQARASDAPTPPSFRFSSWNPAPQAQTSQPPPSSGQVSFPTASENGIHFRPTTAIDDSSTLVFHTITAMPEHCTKSVEELRIEDYGNTLPITVNTTAQFGDPATNTDAQPAASGQGPFSFGGAPATSTSIPIFGSITSPSGAAPSCLFGESSASTHAFGGARGASLTGTDSPKPSTPFGTNSSSPSGTTMSLFGATPIFGACSTPAASSTFGSATTTPNAVNGATRDAEAAPTAANLSTPLSFPPTSSVVFAADPPPARFPFSFGSAMTSPTGCGTLTASSNIASSDPVPRSQDAGCPFGRPTGASPTPTSPTD